MLMEFPGFKKLLNAMPAKLKNAVNSFWADLQKEISVLGYDKSRPANPDEPEQEPEI